MSTGASEKVIFRAKRGNFSSTRTFLHRIGHTISSICLLGLPQQHTTDCVAYTMEIFFAHSSGSQKSEIKVLTGLVSREASLLGLHMAFNFVHTLPWGLYLCE